MNKDVITEIEAPKGEDPKAVIVTTGGSAHGTSTAKATAFVTTIADLGKLTTDEDKAVSKWKRIMKSFVPVSTDDEDAAEMAVA